MITIETVDKKRFTGETAFDVVRAMNAGPLSSDMAVTKSMWKMAGRAKRYSGACLLTQRAEDFLLSLIREGLIILIEGEIK